MCETTSDVPCDRREWTTLIEENRRLAQRYLALEESSRRRIEKLQSAAQRLMRDDSDMRQLIEEAAFGFVLLDHDLCLVNANQALLSMLGYGLVELSGLDFRQVVYVEKLPAFTVMVDAAVSDGAARAEVDLLDKKGGLVPCRLSAGQWKNNQGDNKGVFILVLDVSHEVRIAERMNKLWLASRENEKIREIFVDILGREIRTPVSGIAGMIRMLMDTNLDEGQREFAGVINSSADSLAKLVDNLLEMTRLETNDVKIQLRPFAVSGLCHAVMGFFRNRAEEKGVGLDLTVAPGVPEAALGDAGRLQRVLTHLLDNALKFTDAGRVTISVDIVGDKLRFMVSDTGCGLDPAAGDGIFLEFNSIDSAVAKRQGGLGVGLSICKRLVGLMGGKIGYESSPGRGSEFHFTIPLAPASLDEVSREEDGLVAPAALRLPPLSILAAEANPMALRLVKAVLGLDGHRVVLVDNGLEAAERCRNEVFDVVLLDMLMPDINGLQTLKIIRDDETAAGKKPVPALAVVAGATASSPDKLRQDGFAGAVFKPVRSVELMAAIASAVGVEPLARTPSIPAAGYDAAAAGASIRRIDGRQFATIREIMQDDHFIGVLRMFIEDSVPTIVHIVDMASEPEPDRERIAFAANKARGMAGYLGMHSLADVLARIEQGSKEGAVGEELSALARELRDVTDDTLEELKRIAPQVFVTFSE